MLRYLILVATLFVSGCAGMPGDVVADGGAVNTPIYNSNRLFFLEEDSASPEAVRQTMLHPYQVSYRMREAQNTEDGAVIRSDYQALADRRIQNNEPVAIIVNSVYVPSGLGDNSCKSGRRFDWRGPDGPRDIAVLLDVSTDSANEPSFIAVWYQRGVVQGQALNFDGLHVYSDEAWSASSTPHFRIRLVDVTEERNARTRSLLDTIGSSGSQIAALLGAPVQGPLVEVGRQAASLVLSSQRNRAIIDYTFNAYSIATTEQSGGMALTPFMRGGMMIAGRPCSEDSSADDRYWSQDYYWNQRHQQVYRSGSTSAEPMPFLVATVATVNVTVPAIVAERSQRIVDILTTPLADSADIEQLQADAQSLLRSLDAYAEIRAIRANTQYAQFLSSLNTIANRWDEKASNAWTQSERLYLITQLTQITGFQLASGVLYRDWAQGCQALFVPNPERGRITVMAEDDLSEDLKQLTFGTGEDGARQQFFCADPTALFESDEG